MFSAGGGPRGLNFTIMTTLFLDRDGVINLRTPGDYVKTPNEFQPTEGLGEAMRLLAEKFGRIMVVTNQAGMGKGLMTALEFHAVHQENVLDRGGSGWSN